MEFEQKEMLFDGITIICHKDSIAAYYNKKLIFQAINVKEEDREEYLKKNRNLILAESQKLEEGNYGNECKNINKRR